MLQRTLIITTLVSLCVLLLLLATTTPATAGPFGLLVIFLTSYLAFLGVISFFLFGAGKLIRLLLSGFRLRKPFEPWSLKRCYYYATVLALAPVMLIGLQSVGGAGIYGYGLVLLFEVIGCIYITKRL